MVTAIYTRQSIEKKDSLSIESQIKKCSDICDSNGWEYKVYKDSGYSGGNTERPQFKQMMADIEGGRVRRVIAYRMDRISRSLADFSLMIRSFSAHQVDFLSATEQFDTSTPVGRAMVYIIITFAQLERETIALRISDNWWHRVKSGRYWGGGLPMGYVTEPGMVNGRPGSVLVPDGRDSEIVKDIFRRYNDGQSLRQIALAYNRDGLKTPKGNAWVAAAVLRVLRQAFYCPATPDAYRWFAAKDCNIVDDPAAFDGTRGLVLLGEEHGKDKTSAAWSERVLLVGQHEPLVDAETWIAAQAQTKHKAFEGRQGSSRITWLTKICKCAECGSHFVPRRYIKKQNGKVYYYMYCVASLTRGKAICRHTKNHNVRMIEPLIEDAIFRHIEHLENIPEVPSSRPVESREVNDLEIKLLEIDTKINRLLDQLVDAGSAGKYIKQRIEEMDMERAAINGKLTSLTESNAVQTMNRRVNDVVESVKKKWNDADTTQRGHLASLIIRRIDIDPSGGISIDWLF